MVDIVSAILVIFGLSVFEIATSVDNAVVNADVLSTMSSRGRRFFLLWGILLSVFLVRAGLPFLIVYSIRPEAGIMGVFAGIFNEDPSLAPQVEHSSCSYFSTGSS